MYLVKLSFKLENNIKDFSDKQHREIWGLIIHPIFARGERNIKNYINNSNTVIIYLILWVKQ